MRGEGRLWRPPAEFAPEASWNRYSVNDPTVSAANPALPPQLLHPTVQNQDALQGDLGKPGHSFLATNGNNSMSRSATKERTTIKKWEK